MSRSASEKSRSRDRRPVCGWRNDRPFGERLVALDFTEYQWVGGRRGESYSDWLSWSLAQAEAKEILLILGADDLALWLLAATRRSASCARASLPKAMNGRRADLNSRSDWG